MARRGHVQTKPKKASPTESSADITLSQPDRTPSSHKTLIQIAEERQLLNRGDRKNTPIDPKSVITTTINPDGTLSNPVISLSDHQQDNNTVVATPFLDIFLYTFTLTILHFTLTLLVHHQYSSKPPSLGPLFLSSTVFTLTPTLLFVLVFVLHPRSDHPATQALFAAMSTLAGAWLAYATNEEPYMAIMKKAPVLGTLWIWAIVELKWEWALATLSILGGWGWWKGYKVF
ncbi:hypothetical protein MMC31_008068 [Peltigera leucophlebia]|nr:hypothetical protein [Peltigera leucophlebia]